MIHQKHLAPGDRGDNGAVRVQSAVIRQATALPLAVNNQLPGHSRSTMVAGVTWRGLPKLSFHTDLRWSSSRFVDEENTRKLGAGLVVDCSVRYQMTELVEVFFDGKNIFKSNLETTRGLDGVGYADNPRAFLGGVRLSW